MSLSPGSAKMLGGRKTGNLGDFLQGHDGVGPEGLNGLAQATPLQILKHAATDNLSKQPLKMALTDVHGSCKAGRCPSMGRVARKKVDNPV
jgi:hypothetical protein